MKLYHGTTGTLAKKALKQGIKPRSETGRNNWERAASHPKCVYLTTCYAGYFAAMAKQRGRMVGILEVDADLLDEYLFSGLVAVMVEEPASGRRIGASD